MRRIAVMMGAGSGYANGVMRGIAHYAIAYGPWEFYVQVPGLSIVAMREWQMDGVIVPLRNEEYARVFRDRGIPVVNCSGMLKNPGVPTVRVNDAAAGRIAAQHLLERGFTRFGFAGFPGFDFSDVRREGFEEVVRKAGHESFGYEADPSLRTEWTWDRQEEDLARWLATLPKPIGIMGCNDERAWHVAEACRRIGIKVPEEVAIIGVDNDELRCEFSSPPLSSVAVPTERFGYESAALLDRLMNGKPAPAEPILIQPQGVVVRKSSDILAVDDEELTRAFRCIRDHNGRPFDGRTIAREVGAKAEDLDRRFRERLGRTLDEEIRRARVERARRMLAETDLGLLHVAKAAGFGTPDRLRTALRRETGLAPAAYREKFRLR
jgi:LacI family transcriptional regulator